MSLRLLVGLAFCGGLVILIAGIIGAVLLVLARRPRGDVRNQLSDVVDDWAAKHEYDVLDLGSKVTRDHPFTDRFGFKDESTPGVVHEVTMRDRQGRTRRGWVFIRMRTRRGERGPAFDSYIPASLEVAWED